MTTQAFIQDMVSNNPIVAFTKNWCPYCKAAIATIKNLSKEYNVAYKEVDLASMENGADIQKALAESTGHSTVPNIFINQKHIGGNDDLQKHVRSGQIKNIIETK